MSLCCRGSLIKLSHVGAVAFSVHKRENLFHARRRAPPLHFCVPEIWECWRLFLAFESEDRTNAMLLILPQVLPNRIVVISVISH